MKNKVFCCEQMEDNILEMENISYNEIFDEYGIPCVEDRGFSVMLMKYCPWCGKKLPKSMRKEWVEQLESLGFEAPFFRKKIPEKYRSSKWRQEKYYSELRHYTVDEVKKAINENYEKALIEIPYSVGKYYEDRKAAQDICLQLAEHVNGRIRASAIYGLSYIARVHRCLDRDIVLPVIKREFFDNTEYHEDICAAIDDIILFLKWRKPRWYVKNSK